MGRRDGMRGLVGGGLGGLALLLLGVVVLELEVLIRG